MLTTLYKVVTAVIHFVMFLVEVLRLYLGYEGNLREKVCSQDKCIAHYIQIKVWDIHSFEYQTSLSLISTNYCFNHSIP